VTVFVSEGCLTLGQAQRGALIIPYEKRRTRDAAWEFGADRRANRLQAGLRVSIGWKPSLPLGMTDDR
jgi:hypothetical protein